MKSFIVDTLMGIYGIDESGNIVNFIDFNSEIPKIVEFYESLESGRLSEEYQNFIVDLHNSGFNEIILDNDQLVKLTSQIKDINVSLESDLPEFVTFRRSLEEQLTRIGIHRSQEDIINTYKKVEEILIKNKVSEAGAQGDVIIIQIIETLDILKKSISLFSSRLREWYGLHFPELTDQLVEDNIVLANLISVLGDRKNFTEENITQNFSLKEKRVNRLQDLANHSMGASIDLPIIQSYANQVLSLDKYREDLEEYLEDLMEKIAPNLTTIVGSLIGAKLIAKAGSLKKLAYMPASRIQLLGAEKALYRFLKTGEKRPKHGLIFQWNLIRGSDYHNRGKIARVISGKIGIATKVDYFNGDFIADVLSSEIKEKVKEIEKKYPKPPQTKIKPKAPPKPNKKQYKSKSRN